MSLVVQWLRLCASNAGGTGSIPGHGTKTPPPPKKKRFPGWALIPYDWCPFKKRYLDREERQCAGREETAIQEPRRGAWNRFFPLSLEGTNLLTL